MFVHFTIIAKKTYKKTESVKKNYLTEIQINGIIQTIMKGVMIKMSLNPKISELFDFYGDMLTEKQQDAIRFYYDDDLSLAEIAQNYGVNRQAIHDSIKRAENMLYHMEDKLGLVAKSKKIDENITKIIELAKKIEEVNQKHSFSSDITALTTRIISISNEINE